MAYNLSDPMFQSLYKTGASLLSGLDGEDEAVRKQGAKDALTQTLSQRYARAGLTGGSDEFADMTKTMKDFELDWAERKPKQQLAGIAGTLPIQNFMRSVVNDAEAQDAAAKAAGKQSRASDAALFGGVLSSLGIPQYLANQLFGVTNTGKNTGNGLVTQGISNLWNRLFSGGQNGSGAPSDVFDWWTAADPGSTAGLTTEQILSGWQDGGAIPLSDMEWQQIASSIFGI